MWNTESGARVATAIGVVKWVLIMLACVACVVGVINVALDPNSSISTAVTLALAVVAGTAAWVLFIWVLFGWFEHTLSALVMIARNTADQRERL